MLSPLKLLVVVIFSELTACVFANCVEEFGQCVTNRDCCGYGDGGIECVMGDWSVTTDSTCLSKRSQELDALSKENGFDHQSLTVLLKHFIYQLPEIQEHQRKRYQEKQVDDRFYEKIAEKYRHEFAKLVVSLERKYKITDSETMPRIIRDFVKWKETADLSRAFVNGIPSQGEDIGDREF